MTDLVQIGGKDGCGGLEPGVSYAAAGSDCFLPEDGVHWFGVLFATIGAAAILGALAFVSLLIGGLINAMIVLMAGPLVDRFVVARRR
ncbi:MAG TPA: hypothetical protein VFU46_04590 [Gemmatimonadales bacterium]|nr:hypothetical protein [Gemmatimonadales bacterium]